VHSFLSTPAILRALYELNMAYNIILYNALDVFQETLYTCVFLYFFNSSRTSSILRHTLLLTRPLTKLFSL